MSPVFDCTTDHGRADAIPKAAAGVREGRLVVLPTDTLYGIGADAFSPDAVRALLAAKGRGRDMPPPVLVPDARTVDGLATEVPDYARALVAAFWPGPLTIVLRAQPSLMWDLGDTGGTVALRMPRRPGRARAAARGRPDGGEQRQPHRPPRVAHRRRGRQPARRGRGVLPRRRPGHRRAGVDDRRLHPRRAGLPAGRGHRRGRRHGRRGAGPGRRPRVDGGARARRDRRARRVDRRARRARPARGTRQRPPPSEQRETTDDD